MGGKNGLYSFNHSTNCTTTLSSVQVWVPGLINEPDPVAALKELPA